MEFLSALSPASGRVDWIRPAVASMIFGAHKDIADSQFAFQMQSAHPTLIMSSSTNVNSKCFDEDLESHLAE